ncbi:hypothetical protein JAG45_000134 [Providencia rettgeri]|uniref:hypothetical protein n=1 Tax=Providencia TaxID=586 RepID=UPI000E3C94F5|nr:MULTISPECIES: hypothetical protein [Providencia]EHZ7764291.1 hypothetical protein [Providencia rettgeri]EIJ7167433.1 hypothetical protein [Providencia rettgeri]ELR5089285.1 hypothetical protein [Providencia rettgeri]MCB4812641.1 hypothetical protein [Providencia rettgeri]MCJ2285421.1 hypothetical protein [Providencia rettgeri]
MSYDRHLNILPAESAPLGEVRFVSAREILDTCEVFLGSIKNHMEARLLPTKEYRNVLKQRMEWTYTDKWVAREKQKELIEHGLEKIIHGRSNLYMAEWEYWDSLKQLESDMYLAIQASYKAVNLFRFGDPKYLPMATDVFVVPTQWNKFLGSLMSGEIYPAWVAKVDSSSVPEIEDGIYPKYSPRR